MHCVDNITTNNHTVTATNLYPPPDNLYLADVQPGTLVFDWTPTISNCSTIQYNIITTSECGACPIVTNMTTATCSGIQPTTESDAVLCHIRVSSHACNLVGNPSLPCNCSYIERYLEQGLSLSCLPNRNKLIFRKIIIALKNVCDKN